MKMASTKNQKPSSAKPSPKTLPKAAMKPGHSKPNSKLRMVPVTTPTAKTMIALFAVGVVTGTILSFEFGLLWPGFMAAFGSVFGLGFALEGFWFFVEAIFIAIYVYGWDRLP